MSSDRQRKIDEICDLNQSLAILVESFELVVQKGSLTSTGAEAFLQKRGAAYLSSTGLIGLHRTAAND